MSKKPILDTKTIVIHIMAKEQKLYLSVMRLKKLLVFIYTELATKNKLNEYDITFDIDTDAIELAILHNYKILDIDIEDRDSIYLRHNNKINELTNLYKLDDTIISIIDKFLQEEKLNTI